jgi:hypothetical protein
MSRSRLNLRSIFGDQYVEGWEAIGRLLGKSGRTARRWYDEHHFPVRRAPNGRPYGLISELACYMLEYDRLVSESKKFHEANHQHASMMRSHKKGNKKP